jgi:hypothetical protein
LATSSSNNANIGYCAPCSTSCMYCAVGQPNSCTACFAGAFLNGNSCTSCQFPCITCNSNIGVTSCSSCPSGYLLTASSTCSQITQNSTCGQNCGTCTQTSSSSNPTCVNCLGGYVLTGGLCVTCPNACSICTLDQSTVTNNQPTCSACNIGNYLNLQNNLCQPCGNGCGACFNSSICLACYTGYSITSTYLCFAKCVYPCASCSSTNPTQCTSCVNGFTPDSTSLQGCTANVNTCNSGSNCTVCPFGYNLFTQGNSQTCV